MWKKYNIHAEWSEVGIFFEKIRALKFIILIINYTLGPPNCTVGPPNLGVGGGWAPAPPDLLASDRTWTGPEGNVPDRTSDRTIDGTRGYPLCQTDWIHMRATYAGGNKVASEKFCNDCIFEQVWYCDVNMWTNKTVNQFCKIELLNLGLWVATCTSVFNHRTRFN